MVNMAQLSGKIKFPVTSFEFKTDDKNIGSVIYDTGGWVIKNSYDHYTVSDKVWDNQLSFTITSGKSFPYNDLNYGIWENLINSDLIISVNKEFEDLDGNLIETIDVLIFNRENYNPEKPMIFSITNDLIKQSGFIAIDEDENTIEIAHITGKILERITEPFNMIIFTIEE